VKGGGASFRLKNIQKKSDGGTSKYRVGVVARKRSSRGLGYGLAALEARKTSRPAGEQGGGTKILARPLVVLVRRKVQKQRPAPARVYGGSSGGGVAKRRT